MKQIDYVHRKKRKGEEIIVVGEEERECRRR